MCYRKLTAAELSEFSLPKQSERPSGEGVVRRNGLSKKGVLESLILLEVTLKTSENLKGREETDSPKTPFLDIRFSTRRLLRSFSALPSSTLETVFHPFPIYESRA